MKKVKVQKTNLIVVGIGASAGGLAAFESFFSSLPISFDIDISFVLIQHLSPDSHSMLTEIIKRYTNLQVFEVKDKMKIEPKCVYIIPPNYNMEISGYTFNLIKQSTNITQRLPIDFFFNSLAKEYHENSIGVILSGTGSDGSKGIKTIKENGGLVFVQNIKTAIYEGMPQNALDTGFVDYELTVEDMGANLIHYIKNRDSIDTIIDENNKDIYLKKIFYLLSKHTGHDFSMYKLNTVNRRIEKCMSQYKINSIKEYWNFLNENKNEIFSLFNQLLIGVTNFFRDKEAFESLEKNVIPKLFINKEKDATIRVWVAGCSTGDEAYSIAILLKEYMDKNNLDNQVNIFASDIDLNAIIIARNRIFPFSIENDVSLSRLEQFFHKNSNGYTIDKTIRDMIIFSEHNIIKDPPFSKLDLLSCRNVLIYMNVELQKNLILQFHYALYPNGILFLGSSESIGDFGQFFDAIDQKNNIFQCNNTNTTNTIIPNRIREVGFVKKLSLNTTNTPFVDLKLPIKELFEHALLKYLSPTAVLVDEDGNILYLSGESSKYLEIPQGEAIVNNIFNMLKEELKIEVLKAFNKVKQSKLNITIENLNIKTNDSYEIVNISILSTVSSSGLESSDFLYLVVFENNKSSLEKKEISNLIPSKNIVEDESTTIKTLREELKKQKKFLQDSNERLLLSNQELKSYNEEIQSMNEELQSTNEELETSREELQSLNEELSIVNAELQSKVTDLTTVNNDMNNLISGTGIGTIFVDNDLHILHFTPTIKQIINLIPGDIGRFLGDIVLNIIDYKELISDTQNVLDTLIPKEIEVQAKNGLWFLMRIQPYRTIENVIEGAVISFVNITEIVNIRQKLQKLQSG